MSLSLAREKRGKVPLRPGCSGFSNLLCNPYAALECIKLELQRCYTPERRQAVYPVCLRQVDGKQCSNGVS